MSGTKGIKKSKDFPLLRNSEEEFWWEEERKKWYYINEGMSLNQ